ncbi:MAG: EAL domain-containing protein [Terracidiphilus sp.]
MNLPENSYSANQRMMEDVLACIPDAVVVLRGKRIAYVNAAFTRIFGYTAEEAIGGNLRELIVPEARQQEIALLRKTMEEFGSASLDTVRKNKEDALMEVALEVRPLAENGEKAGLVITFRDIGVRKRMEAKLQHDALHDTLTGLPNRALFLDRLNQAFIQRSRRRGQNCGVLFLDLDRFKEINDSLGHAAGDELLIAVAERLCGALRPQDTAARLGGDEFAILVENIRSIADIKRVASRVLQAMEPEFKVCGRTLRAFASIGVAMAAPDHVAPEMLIRDADFAMYHAKQDGGGRFEIFDKQLEVAATSLHELEQELRRVLDEHQFEVWYQPICGLSSGKLEGFESLLCWRRADGTVATFSDLQAIAEETGLSISLGREKMGLVCRQLQIWTEALPQIELTLATNVTLRQFYHPDFVAQLKKTLAATGADPARLLLEIGEATLSENPDAALAVFERLLDCNVRLAVGDFGSGLAPLNHLVRLPLDVLKLEPRLTLAATHTGRQVAVLESLIQLGSKLGVQVIAQGIETQQQLEALVRMGCEVGQGPLLSPALDLSHAQRFAERGTWKFAPEA